MNPRPSVEPLESRIAPAAIVVNTIADSIDAPNSPVVSLRDAIVKANTNPGADTITFKAGVTGTMNLLHGEFLITDTLSIKGPGSGKLILNAGGSSRIFDCADSDFNADHPVSISGLALIDGSGTGLNSSGRGGAIYSTESLTLAKSVVSGNSASGSGVGQGGGVYVDATGTAATFVSIKGCVISGNSSSAEGGGLNLFAKKSVQITNSLILNNSAQDYAGGAQLGLGEDGTSFLLKGDTVSANKSPGRGGGLAFTTEGGAAPTILGSNIFNNTSSGTGGGIYFDMLANTGSAVIKKSTISNNSALSGGGVYLSVKTSVTMAGVTMDGNHATDGKGGGLYLGGSFLATLAPVNISSSHFDDNTASQNGGGISSIGGLALNLSNTTIDGNQAGGGGGGILSNGQLAHRTDLKITGGEISQNTTLGVGGGVYAPGDGNVTISGTKVTHNTANASIGGGGLCINTTGAVKLAGIIVSGNSAVGFNGGGVSINANGAMATFSIKGGSFTNNFATETGGGIYVSGTGKGSIVGVKVMGNIAGQEAGGVNNDLGTLTNITASGNTISGNVAPLDPDQYGL